MLIYGKNPVREALRGRRQVNVIWATRAAESEGWLREARSGPNSVDKFEWAEAEELDTLCDTNAHQGVCAEVDPYPYADPEALYRQPDALIVALDEVQDPQNLGAVCRVAECAGATGVVIPERRSADITAAVCKASAGAVEHLPVARVSNLADYLVRAKAEGAWVYGAAGGARQAYDQPDYKGGVILVMGSEGKGLRKRVADNCDALISLPVRGHIESLNVSTASAVILYEILQNRSRNT